MKVKFKKEPFEHFVFEDFYSNEELQDVWQDLDFVEKYTAKDNNFKETRAAIDSNGNPMTSRKGMFLDNFFNNNNYREKIKTYIYARKIYVDEKVTKTGTIGPIISHTNHDFMLFQFYRSNDYYKPHKDASLFTFLCYLWKEQKDFTGGVLKFDDYNYQFDPSFNSAILFPSCMYHSVSEITSLTQNNNIAKRICITMFLGLEIRPS